MLSFLDLIRNTSSLRTIKKNALSCFSTADYWQQIRLSKVHNKYRFDEENAIRLQASLMKIKILINLLNLKLLKKCWSQLYFGTVYRWECSWECSWRMFLKNVLEVAKMRRRWEKLSRGWFPSKLSITIHQSTHRG